MLPGDGICVLRQTQAYIFMGKIKTNLFHGVGHAAIACDIPVRLKIFHKLRLGVAEQKTSRSDNIYCAQGNPGTNAAQCGTEINPAQAEYFRHILKIGDGAEKGDF